MTRASTQLTRKSANDKRVLMDSSSGSEWNFKGCATGGPKQGKYLNRLSLLNDFWFDWRTYHPTTSVFRH
jgi:hypothetical protein